MTRCWNKRQKICPKIIPLVFLKVIFCKLAIKDNNFLATFESKFNIKNFQKLPNLVTLIRWPVCQDFSATYFTYSVLVGTSIIHRTHDHNDTKIVDSTLTWSIFAELPSFQPILGTANLDKVFTICLMDLFRPIRDPCWKNGF